MEIDDIMLSSGLKVGPDAVIPLRCSYGGAISQCGDMIAHLTGGNNGWTQVMYKHMKRDVNPRQSLRSPTNRHPSQKAISASL
jgi:hypothetical protein